jgi:hypothetical protein
MARTIALLALSCALGGCVTESIVQARPAASKVTIVNEVDKPFRCKTLADIHGTSRSTDEAKAKVGAQNDFKNQAAKFRANYAMVEAENSGNIGSSTMKEVFIRGKALRCEEPEKDAPAEQ